MVRLDFPLLLFPTKDCFWNNHVHLCFFFLYVWFFFSVKIAKNRLIGIFRTFIRYFFTSCGGRLLHASLLYRVSPQNIYRRGGKRWKTSGKYPIFFGRFTNICEHGRGSHQKYWISPEIFSLNQVKNIGENPEI